MPIRIAVAIAATMTAATGCSSTDVEQSAGSINRTTSSGPASTLSARPLPASPIEGRIGAGVVWTGTDMIVWGGVARSGIPAPVADGAAYSPDDDTWRRLAAAPPGVLGDVGNGAAWTGTEAVFWAGNSPDGPAAGAVYNPTTDRWRRLPDGPLGPRQGYVSVWTGRELLLIGGTTGDGLSTPRAAAVDPGAGTWRLLSALNASKGFMPSAAVWNGREVFLAGTTSLCPEQGSVCTEYRPTFVAFDPAADRTRDIGLADAPFDAAKTTLVAVGWVGSEAVFTADRERRIVRYDPGGNAWRRAPPAPCPTSQPGYEQAAVAGLRWLIPCGDNEIQIFDLPTETWQKAAIAGRSPLAGRASSAIAWSGTELLVWSGTEPSPGNRTPNDGAALRLPS